MKPERTARSYRRLVKGMTRPRTFAEFLAASSAQRRCREFCPVACTRPASAHGSTRPLPPRRKSEGQRYGFPRYKIKIFLLRSRGNRPPAPGRPAAPGHAERDEALLLNCVRETRPRPPDPLRSRRDIARIVAPLGASLEAN